MNKRPASVTIISWLFIALGGISLIAGLFRPGGTTASGANAADPAIDTWLVPGVRILAVVCGAFMLRGFNWARRLLVVWIAYHVILSALHSTLQLVVHGLLFGVALYFLFRPAATAYFRGPNAGSTQNPPAEV
jgi:uncharacterized membrane protein